MVLAIFWWVGKTWGMQGSSDSNPELFDAGALGGHLVLIEVLVQSFTTLPAGTSEFGRDGLWSVAAWGSEMFAGAVRVALPAVVALLVVNLAYGVISRAAPTLTLFAVGFPATVLLGFLILQFSFQTTLVSLTGMLENAFAALGAMTGFVP